MNAASSDDRRIVRARIAILLVAALAIGYLGWQAYSALVPTSAAPEPPSLDDSVVLTSRARAFHEAARAIQPPAAPPRREEEVLTPPTVPPPPVMPPPPLPPSSQQLANHPQRPESRPNR